MSGSAPLDKNSLNGSFPGESSKARALMIAAPASGSGKTTTSIGLAAAMGARGLDVAVAKTGPDYIDGSFLGRAAGSYPVNLDPWAMGSARLRSLAMSHGRGADFLLVEGVMGLFDGAADGNGSSADLAAALGLPVILVADAAGQSHSIAALVSGFCNWRADIKVSGLILNNVASSRHERILKDALESVDIEIVGSVPRQLDLEIPGRHLGLVLAGEIDGIDGLVRRAGRLVANHCDLDRIFALARPMMPEKPALASVSSGRKNFCPLPPLGQHIAIARDRAFAFFYRHWLYDWRNSGARISFFSPLNDEAPDEEADAIFLPGGYPELFAEQISMAGNFLAGLSGAAGRGVLIYGECGGFMVLGKTLTDGDGRTYGMAGLLPHDSSIASPRRILGYRSLVHDSPLPWAKNLCGHEFHYSIGSSHSLPALFGARDATGRDLPPMGAMNGRVLGSYAHVIDACTDEGGLALHEAGGQ